MFLKERDAQEYPDNDAHQNQEPVHEACAQFRFSLFELFVRAILHAVSIRSGNYLLMKGDLKSEDIVELMQETFRFIRSAATDINMNVLSRCLLCSA